MADWMIYGANGYTGELIAREAKSRGLTPVLAGRSASVKTLADQLGLRSRIFALESGGLAKEIAGMKLVLHCAGPFSTTARPMMEACLGAGAHYLDITGEISVFELAACLDTEAEATGIVIIPGVGFDVVPTDCVAATLKAALPTATSLALGFDSRSGFSPGTAKTSVEGLGQGGKVRRDGAIVSVPLAWKTRHIDFGGGEKLAMTIPWGDVSTAWHSTGIPNVETYIPASPKLVARLKRLNWVRPFLGLSPVQAIMKSRIAKSVRGPSEETREKTPTFVWGEAANQRGERRIARLQTPNGYTLTVTASLGIVEHLLKKEVQPGFRTPSRLMGADYVTTLPGCGAIVVSKP
ncbi:MAG: saccharopine dehydrogenase NADP-binding domain-containing protein [Betaproteobacteria bacterium]|nr:saccharopine dehydrogenase NADP-binding domain-containing protein [Betaproteobacteria bacterium]